MGCVSSKANKVQQPQTAGPAAAAADALKTEAENEVQGKSSQEVVLDDKAKTWSCTWCQTREVQAQASAAGETAEAAVASEASEAPAAVKAAEQEEVTLEAQQHVEEAAAEAGERTTTKGKKMLQWLSIWQPNAAAEKAEAEAVAEAAAEEAEAAVEEQVTDIHIDTEDLGAWLCSCWTADRTAKAATEGAAAAEEGAVGEAENNAAEEAPVNQEGQQTQDETTAEANSNEQAADAGAAIEEEGQCQQAATCPWNCC